MPGSATLCAVYSVCWGQGIVGLAAWTASLVKKTEKAVSTVLLFCGCTFNNVVYYQKSVIVAAAFLEPRHVIHTNAAMYAIVIVQNEVWCL